MRNGPNTSQIYQLSLQLDVCVFREKQEWTGLFKLLAINRETCIVSMCHRLVQFRTTVIKLYYDTGNTDITDDIVTEDNPDNYDSQMLRRGSRNRFSTAKAIDTEA